MAKLSFLIDFQRDAASCSGAETSVAAGLRSPIGTTESHTPSELLEEDM